MSTSFFLFQWVQREETGVNDLYGGKVGLGGGRIDYKLLYRIF